MQYMILCYENQTDFDARNDGAKAQAYWGAWGAYAQALQQAGVMVNGNGLQPPQSSTTVRLLAGKRQVQDGPIADTKEQLGGYFIIEAANLDAALEWGPALRPLRQPALKCGPFFRQCSSPG